MKKAIKFLLFALILLPCAMIMTACGGDKGGGDNGGGNKTYSATELNEKLANIADSYDYKNISLTASLTKGKDNVTQGESVVDEMVSDSQAFMQSTSNGEKCFVTLLDDGMKMLNYLSGMTDVIYIDDEDTYYYTEQNMDLVANPNPYIKTGLMSESDKSFV